jgi:hypothetical protein
MVILAAFNTPPLADCCNASHCAGCCIAPVVSPPLPRVLSSRRLRLVTAAPLPRNAPPPPPIAPPLLVRWRLSSHFPPVHRLVAMSHLATPPPHAHVFILNPRLIHAHWLVVPLHLVALPTSRRQLTSLLPLIRPNWLPVCLTWYA